MSTYGGVTTQQGCAAKAKAASAHYFGMQYPQGTSTPNTAQCYYGNTPFKYSPAVCSNRKDSSGNYMGDSSVNAVYDVYPITTPVTSYLGCYKDNTSSRSLPTLEGTMTLAACARAVKPSGVGYFGMQYPQGTSVPNTAQCWAGKGPYNKYGSATCSRKNASGDYMGDSSVNAVYKVS
jgi:hypothetical protein